MAIALAGWVWVCGLLACSSAFGIEIQFDYRFDRSGFFSGASTASIEHRIALEAAAAAVPVLSDSLLAISPSAGSSWSVSFRHPSWTSFIETATVTDLIVPRDTLVVFVGASPSFSSVLGAADRGITSAAGPAAFLDTVNARGQSGVLQAVPSDFGPWGGSIWFNSTAPWYFGLGTDGLQAAQSDFLTTATHELFHLLGIGEAPSCAARSGACTSGVGLCFDGPASALAYGDAVPLDAIGAHWAEGVMSTAHGLAQETLMDPTTGRGVREDVTLLDAAALSDIGWQVSPVPENSIWASFLLGFGLLGALRRRSK